MGEHAKIDWIGDFGYGVYNLPGGKFAIADPLDDNQGFYLVVDSIDAFKEMQEMELI